jgi:hypothetical protein
MVSMLLSRSVTQVGVWTGPSVQVLLASTTRLVMGAVPHAAEAQMAGWLE